jgi:hypothetical protein
VKYFSRKSVTFDIVFILSILIFAGWNLLKSSSKSLKYDLCFFLSASFWVLSAACVISFQSLFLGGVFMLSASFISFRSAFLEYKNKEIDRKEYRSWKINYILEIIFAVIMIILSIIIALFQ